MPDDSPPPQIIQLRGLLQDLIIAPLGNPLTKTDEQLELAIALVDRLIEQYPALTTAADGRRWPPQPADRPWGENDYDYRQRGL